MSFSLHSQWKSPGEIWLLCFSESKGHFYLYHSSLATITVQAMPSILIVKWSGRHKAHEQNCMDNCAVLVLKHYDGPNLCQWIFVNIMGTMFSFPSAMWDPSRAWVSNCFLLADTTLRNAWVLFCVHCLSACPYASARPRAELWLSRIS